MDVNKVVPITVGFAIGAIGCALGSKRADETEAENRYLKKRKQAEIKQVSEKRMIWATDVVQH